MERIALYRKYRPKDFNNVYGQKIITQTLTNSIKTQCINHAYIFAGNKGCGKTSLAKIFAKAINCTNPKDGNPCNECANCLAINDGSCNDVLELDAASNSGINEMRTLIESIGYLPNQLKYKVYIIDEAHMLTNNSWNALLKTLEEPPKHVVIIFATTEYHKIPATIVSRCQRYDICKISKDLLNQLIVNVAYLEDIKIDQDAISAISTLANGSARDALSILDQMSSFCSKHIKKDALDEMFGLVNIDNKIGFINTLLNGDFNQCLELIESYYKHGINFLVLAGDILQILMDKLIYLQTKNTNLLQILTVEKSNLVNTSSVNGLLDLINAFNDNFMKLKTTDQPKFVFEYLCINALEKINGGQTSAVHPRVQSPTPVHAPQAPAVETPTPAKHSFVWSAKSTSPTEQVIPGEKIDKTRVLSPELGSAPEIETSLFKTSENKDINPTTVTAPIQEKKTVELPVKPIVDHKPTNPLPTYTNNLFENNEQIDEPPVSPVPTFEKPVAKDKPTIDIYDEQYKMKFFAVAANRLRNDKDKHNQILDNLKEMGNPYDAEINCFLAGSKFILVSEHGCVLLFGNRAQVERFEKIKKQKNFLEFFNQSFGKNQEIFGVDEQIALKWKLEFQNLSEKKFDDVKIIVNFVDEKKTKLLDILSLSDLEDDDDEGNLH